MRFDIFVGIDWSGAKGHAHRGLSAFVCYAGNEVPQKISPPHGKKAFSRQDIIDVIDDLACQGRVLVGIDFAFAYPIDEAGHYFPELDQHAYQPEDAFGLWALIDRLNQGAPDYYGGLIWDDPIYGAYYNAPSGRKGARFASRRRATEIAASAIKSPSPTFNCVGPAGVGTGSLAGMRLCHAFQSKASIWPFSSLPDAPITLVEIFPSFYFKMAGIHPVKGAQAQVPSLNQALGFFQTQAVDDDFIAHGPDADDADALISAAALRALSAVPHTWDIHEKAVREGWIFGVTSDKTSS